MPGSAGEATAGPDPIDVVSRDHRTTEDRRMASTDASPSALALAADDEAESARWLAGLIEAVQSDAERRGYPEVASTLEEALNAARIIADRERTH